VNNNTNNQKVKIYLFLSVCALIHILKLKCISIYRMQNYNMMSSIGYINNVMLKVRVYFNSHMRIVGQIMGII
jgi:hypothetical protein